MTRNTVKISAIIACYKDGQAIPIMAQRLHAVFEKIGVDYEAIFVNDGSPDDSQTVLESLARSNYRIKVIQHSRNFGSQNAFSSGLNRATGDACVLLDGDLQDPPEVIEQLYLKWKEGYDIAYGVRVKREMPWHWEICYRAFYRVLNKVAFVTVPVDAGDFSLMDRRVVQELIRIPERDRFIRGLRAWVGFKQVGVPYVRPERMFGTSTNNLWKNIAWARKGIFAFTFVPLEIVSVSAVVLSIISALAILGQIIGKILYPDIPHGISTVIVASLFLGSVQLVCLSFIAEYLGKIFEEVKQRPLYIVQKTLNFEDESSPQPIPQSRPHSRHTLDL